MTSLITSVAEEMNPSRRNTMEDCSVIYSPGTWGCDDGDMTYLAICDGHGGRDIVEFLEHTLDENIAEELNEKDDASIHVKLERAFLITDVQSHEMGIDTSGATVALCLIKKKPNQRRVVIHAANVGDARAVLSCTPSRTSQQSPPPVKQQSLPTQNSNDNGSSNYRKERKAYRLTFDHRADDPIEGIRIDQAGGFVARDRVLGVLAVARSMGDHGMKEFVIGKPFVNTVEVDLEDSSDDSSSSSNSSSDQFVIVACDGLWDVVEDQNAVNLVREFLAGNAGEAAGGKGSKHKVAQMLCDVALKRGSSDNISVVVTWL